jgi:hypothetical protein
VNGYNKTNQAFFKRQKGQRCLKSAIKDSKDIALDALQQIENKMRK